MPVPVPFALDNRLGFSAPFVFCFCLFFFVEDVVKKKDKVSFFFEFSVSFFVLLLAIEIRDNRLRFVLEIDRSSG